MLQQCHECYWNSQSTSISLVSRACKILLTSAEQNQLLAFKSYLHVPAGDKCSHVDWDGLLHVEMVSLDLYFNRNTHRHPHVCFYSMDMTQAEHFLCWILYLTSFSTWISLDSVHCHKHTAPPFDKGNKAERVLRHMGQDLLRQLRVSFYSRSFYFNLCCGVQ